MRQPLRVTADNSANRRLLKRLKEAGLIEFNYNNLEDARKNVEESKSGWRDTNNPAFLTLDISNLDDADVLAPKSAPDMEKRLRSILGGGKHNLEDRRHLIGHFYSGNDVFVTGDKDDISSKKQELAALGIIVLHNDELESYIASRVAS